MHVAAACRPAAELASFWNKPIVSWVATDPEFDDKTVYTTLGRTLGPFNKMGTFLAEVFKQYNWRKVVVISSNFFLWLDAGKAIRKVNMGNFCCHVYRFCVLFCFSFTGSCGCFLSRALLSGSHCVMSRCMSCCTSWANKDVCMYVCCHCCLVFFLTDCILSYILFYRYLISRNAECSLVEMGSRDQQPSWLSDVDWSTIQERVYHSDIQNVDELEQQLTQYMGAVWCQSWPWRYRHGYWPTT